MKKHCVRYFAFLLGLGCLVSASAARAEDGPTPAPTETREFTFNYQTVIEAPAKGSGPIEVFIPIAKSDQFQKVSSTITSNISGQTESEPRFGNTFWHGHLDASDGEPITVTVAYQVNRSANNALSAANARPDKELSPEVLASNLQPDRLVPVSGTLLDKIKGDLPKNDGTPLAKARAIYDYVVANMEYKKVGTGWGNGDTHWACSEKYGNCADFHALFISLARSEGIPARFEIGFPIDVSKPTGDVGGYHCWALFYIAGKGWLPIDASEAKKHPEQRQALFGSQPADRLKLSEGRDLTLGSSQKSKPLNYFIYPHVEVKGERYDKLKNTFSYGQIAKR